MGSRHTKQLRKKSFKCMLGTSTHCMICRHLCFSLPGVHMEGSHAHNARQLLSFIGCRPVESIHSLTCIDSSCLLTSIHKNKKNFMKGKVVKHSAPPVLMGAQI